MMNKYAIDYIILPRHRRQMHTHHTDDPVEAEDFLMHLLTSGAHIKMIRHDGVELSAQQADHMLKIAAERVAASLLCESLGMDAADARHRFGLAM